MPTVRGALRQGGLSVRVRRSRVSLLYAFEEFGHTYIGCMQRVYGVEIDLEMLHEAEAKREGFGAMRATRAPLPMCRVEVEECYGSEHSGELGCVNPEFHELPVGRPTFKVFAQLAD